jgi:methylenetetrahydrofolate dehydrogenase (NADP+)/methenyltetrahydrofolate cyclohydrolase
LIGPGHVSPGPIVIDVGTNATPGGLAGDVDPAVAEVAGALTPVPGGVGPVTRRCSSATWSRRRAAAD